jgi:ubiquitin carboxyl-terminal hydrolase 25/28
MDNKDSPRPRRPLPVPGATRSSPAQRPNTPIDEAIPPSSFYSTPQSQHPQNYSTAVEPGSAFTSVISTEKDANDYREPELVTAQGKGVDPAPRSTEFNDTGEGGWTTDEWNQQYDISAWNNGGASSSWNEGFSGANTINVPIDGRSEYEEKNWWDSGVRITNKRPGVGILPPVLLEDVHDSEHSLFSINITGLPRQSSENIRTSSPTPSAALYSPPPPLEEVRTSVPHPNAYFCPRDNGWVILSWKSSSIEPPLAASFDKCDHPPLPNQARRKEAVSCVVEDGKGNNLTHHFHKYFKAVDAHKLTPPLKADEWEVESARASNKKDTTAENMQPQEEGMLLDLYVCCQCSFYFVASDLIPGVIPRRHMDSFVKDKRSNPPPGKTGEQAAVIALETIMLYVSCVHLSGNILRLLPAH